VITTRGKKKTYVAEFHHHGQHRKVSLKTANKKVAIDRATTLANQLIHGGYQTAPKNIGVREATAQYVDHLETEGRARRTIVKYRGVFKNFLEFLKALNVTRLDQVLPGHFDRYRAHRKQSRKPKTLYTEGVILKQFFSWAKTRKLLADNPLAEVKLKKPMFVAKPAPNLDEVNALLAVARDPLRQHLAVLAFTGMRAGELQRLRPEDVDLDGNWIHIVSRDGAETKTRRSRKVPIHPRLRPVFEGLPRRARPYLFTSQPSQKYPEGNRPINTKRLNDRFKVLLAKLKFPVGRDNGYVVHSLRHFVETFTINANIPQRVVDAWLGHYSDKSMGAIYYKLSDADSQRFMKLVPFGAPDTTEAS
jgi:integrase